MTTFVQHKIVQELAELTYTMWSMGWDEKNGGNISYLFHENEVDIFTMKMNELILLPNIPENLVGKYVLITAAGSNFRLIKENIAETVGLIKIENEGYCIVQGFENGNRPTSEVYMHLLSHSARLEIDNQHRVIVHNHATEISEMTFVHELEDKSFTKALWRMITECIVVFPDGIGVLPWMICGNEEIGIATANKLKSSRIVVWGHHGVLATGADLNDAFGLIETVNKAAKIYVNTLPKRMTEGITDQQLADLCVFFNIVPKEGYLEV